MAFQFPPGPAVDQTFTPVAGVTYRWSGMAWHLLAGPGSFISQADADTRYVNVDEAPNLTNRIINGKFAIDQRNAGAAVIVSAGVPAWGADRWTAYTNLAPGQLRTQSTSFLSVMVWAADPVLDAGDIALIEHKIEGLNVADMRFGLNDASAFTVAFDIRCNISATLAMSFRNSAATRSYIKTFAVTANTMHLISFTVPGDTTGTWLTNNSIGLSLTISIGAGNTYVAPVANAWQAGNYLSAPGVTNLMTTSGNEIQLFNIRLYKGSVDFGPDRRLYAEELALCQRYYEKTFPIDTAPAAGLGTVVGVLQGTGTHSSNTEPYANWMFSVEKRAAPTVTLYNPRAGGVAGQWTDGVIDSANGRCLRISTRNAIIDNTSTVVGPMALFIAATASAEL